MSFQNTLASSVSFEGAGLHTGRHVTITLKPAPPDTGIVFVRSDTSPPVSIRAVVANIVNTRLSTTIGSSGYAVASVEHLLAAFFAARVDNAIVEVDGPEIPIMDGSSLPFLDGLRSAGLTALSVPRQYLIVTRPVSIVENRCSIAIYPSDDFMVTSTMIFRHPAVSSQSRRYIPAVEDFCAEYVPARTFGFLNEVEQLKAQGLARGGGVANAVIIGANGVLNREGLRFPDEPVRHKILDLTGDLLLAGRFIIGHVRAFRSGHYLNWRLVERLLSRRDSWILGESEGKSHCSLSQRGTGFGHHSVGCGYRTA